MSESERKIKVFKNFEEQEADHSNWLKNTTPQERFASLFKMQQFDASVRRKTSGKRTITIHHGYLQQ